MIVDIGKKDLITTNDHHISTQKGLLSKFKCKTVPLKQLW